MDVHEIEALQALRGFPAVTIMLPTEQAWPDVRQNPVRVKNLVREAERRLRSECSARIWTPLIEKLDALADHIDYAHGDAGLALFVSKDIARFATLPFPVQERVTIDETFATRDRVAAVNRRGCPSEIVTIAFACQPPSAALIAPFNWLPKRLPFPNGSS